MQFLMVNHADLNKFILPSKIGRFLYTVSVLPLVLSKYCVELCFVSPTERVHYISESDGPKYQLTRVEVISNGLGKLAQEHALHVKISNNFSLTTYIISALVFSRSRVVALLNPPV